MKPLGYWLVHVHQLLEAVLDATLRTESLTRRHWQALNTIANGAGTQEGVERAMAPFVTQGDLMNPLLDDFRHRGWLTTSTDGTGFTLTEDGRAAHVRTQNAVVAYRAMVTEGVSDEEYLTTHRVLERVAANLEAATRN
ncbi:MarR family winged helix-turn-helix transcriptional regulator [Amycolatopsis sp. H20-H5]|uniref:MarR family winged helix-turn-helix transcriptional regulator n=1 Tax=Amycolatopsis sp. H20-H5 TaxID=3046309 RepID=UPI002DBEB13F|nr:MarR family transcriptional regulator [Amycolatopsis sp. H20-H5]MEC3974669.1 MarR family transcriptional regulator [Amycolatopsis sp. H20-H5]